MNIKEEKKALVGLLLRPHEAQREVCQRAVHNYHADECERVVSDPVRLEGEIFDDVIATKQRGQREAREQPHEAVLREGTALVKA